MNPPITSGAFDRNERVLVIGLGRSGRASIAVLGPRVAAIYATDEDANIDISALSVPFIAPAALGDVLPNVTAAVLSPGIPLNSELVRRVQSAGVPVFSEVEVAYRICRAPIVAVTGTKGKTTTAALLGDIFRQAGQTTFVGGNIGNALIAETAVAGPNDWVIAEVSSFQLESIRSFKPRIALINNISPDHLDRYFSMDEYAEAKFRIFANQGSGDTFIGNLDDERIAGLATAETNRIKGRTLWFSSQPHRNAALYVNADATIVYAPPAGDPRPLAIMHVDEIPLQGKHNLENVLGAILAGFAAGLERAAIVAAVRAFKPLAHRLEAVAERNGVTYVDDSKATNPGSVIAALRAFDRPIVLIAGGKAKGTEFADLGRVASSRTRAVVLIGEAADAIARTIKRASVRRAASMNEAVAIAASIAVSGDVVLLSPGCASFDMFRSAEDRGLQFRAAVASLGGAQLTPHA